MSNLFEEITIRGPL